DRGAARRSGKDRLTRQGRNRHQARLGKGAMMAVTTRHERRLSELQTPRRNHYYYSKLMDVLHFEMEQRYEMSKRWLLNRTVLGSGVICGLELTPIETSAGRGIRIGA